MPAQMWLLPILVILVLVVSLLIKAQEAANKTPRKPPREGERPEGVRRGNSDFERFLQDIERTRQRDTTTAPKRARPAPLARAAPAPVTQATAEVTPLTTEQPLPRVVVRLPIIEAAAAPTYGAGSFGQLPPELGASSTPVSSGGTVRIDAILHSRELIRTAMILQEVLAPPRCRRPLRG